MDAPFYFVYKFKWISKWGQSLCVILRYAGMSWMTAVISEFGFIAHFLGIYTTIILALTSNLIVLAQ